VQRAAELVAALPSRKLHFGEPVDPPARKEPEETMKPESFSTLANKSEEVRRRSVDSWLCRLSESPDVPREPPLRLSTAAFEQAQCANTTK
jgi:hypothetical protein